MLIISGQSLGRSSQILSTAHHVVGLLTFTRHYGVIAMPSFEESLKKLESIVDQLEKGDLALENSLKLFEEGVGLSAACKQELDAAEGKVQMLVKQRDGSLKAEPFLTEKPF